MIPPVLAAALREALADAACDTPDTTTALIAEHLADLTADDLERALDALVTVAAVGQTMLARRGLVTA